MNKFIFLCVLIFSIPAFAGITVSEPIHYGPDKRQIIQIYQPDNCKNRQCPVTIWVHGGGWKNGDTTRGAASDMLNSWANQGIIMVGINYRLSPDVVHPAHVQDVAAAIAWVHQNIGQYGGDQNRLFLLGHSAGAHLVALVATNPTYLAAYGLTPKNLKGVFPIDTASFDLTEPSRFVKRMVDDAFGTDKAVLREASPIWNVRAGGQYPSFIIAAAKVRRDAVETSNILEARLKAVGVDAELIIMDYPKAGSLKAHGLIAKDLAKVDNSMTKQLIDRVLVGQ
jgi:acetyl esterase/lipase